MEIKYDKLNIQAYPNMDKFVFINNRCHDGITFGEISELTRSEVAEIIVKLN